MTLEKRSTGHVVGHAGGTPGGRPLAVSDMGLGAVHSLERRLHVDEHVGRQDQLDLRSSSQKLSADHPAQLREQHGQTGVVVGRRLLAVDGYEQLVAFDAAEPIEHEVSEKHAPPGSGQRVLDPPTAKPDHESAAQLDSRPAGRCHGHTKRRA